MFIRDRSYFLFGMRQDQLAATLMPVGHYPKAEIRRMALDAGFPNSDKPDSQDICFIPTGDYRGFLRQRTDEKPGEIVDAAGNLLGQHDGIQYFTVGQRRGLGLSGGPPRFVIRLEPDTRRVVVGSEESLYHDTLYAAPVSWVAGIPPAPETLVSVKIRYKFAEAPATVTAVGDGALVRFNEPQRAITPGQAAVFYQGETVLGGGPIAGYEPQPATPAVNPQTVNA